MSYKLLLAVISISVLIGAVLGYALKTALIPKTVLIPGETKSEVIIKRVPVRIKETKYVDVISRITDTVFINSSFSLADSIKGLKDSVEYNAVHFIEKKKDSVKSRWDISVSPLFKESIKEKLVVKLQEVEVTKPFFADGWFWAAFIAIPLLFLAIIF